jgi:hypothetical protein
VPHVGVVIHIEGKYQPDNSEKRGSREANKTMKKHSAKRKRKQSIRKTGSENMGWVGTLDANASIWTLNEKPLGIWGLMGAFTMISLMMLLVLLPAYGLAEGIIFLKTGAFYLESVILLIILATSLIGGAIIFVLLCQRQVIRFTFDASRKVLEFTERRPFFKPSKTLVDFNAIFSITPTLMASYSTKGHFSVAFETANGSIIDKMMGHNISVDNLNLHAAWLASHLGDRVHPMLNLDK